MTAQEHNGRMLEELWELGESFFDPGQWEDWLEGCCDHCGERKAAWTAFATSADPLEQEEV